MSLHKLAEVTITVYGLPEYCGTDEQFQELTDEAESLLEFFMSYQALSKVLHEEFPSLDHKIQVIITGI